MHIQTELLGDVEVQESEVLTFENGLLGFLEYKRFVLIALDADLPLALLQSTEEAAISFVLAYPFAFKKDYTFDLSQEDKEELKIKEANDVIAYTIVTLKETFADSTLNLLAPVIINMNEKLGKQIVLQDNAKYPLRHLIGTVEGSVK